MVTIRNGMESQTKTAEMLAAGSRLDSDAVAGYGNSLSHSARSASIGFTAAARRAGTKQAIPETKSSSAITAR